MIYPASSLFLATLVFNAASAWGAPVPVSSDGSSVVRSTGEDVLPRKMTIIDVVPHLRSVDPQQVDARDTASSSSASLEARDPLPEVERIVRRFPRKVYQDFYEKRSPSLDDESTPPVARSPVERRFPRRALYERHESRSNPAPPEARSDTEPSDIQRRYPRRVYADYYQKRELSPPINVAARNPAPELTDSGRRFPRRVYAEHFEKRQEDPAVADPAAPPPAASADATAATPVAPTASVSVSASASTATATSSNVVPSPLDVNSVIKKITSGDTTGYQPGTTIKETTLLINKITHISDKGTADQKAAVPPVSGTKPGTPSSAPATPSSTAATASSSAAAAPSSTPATGDEPVTPPVVAAPTPESTAAPATPEADAAATPAVAAPVADEATPAPVAGGDASRRSLGGSNQASRQPIIRRQLGYSGPAWASHLKRNVNN